MSISAVFAHWDGKSEPGKDLADKFGIYRSSFNSNEKCTCFLIRENQGKSLVVTEGSEFGRFDGTETLTENMKYKICPLNNRNAGIIMEVFPFAKPCTASSKASMGLGDRLGMASAGHLRLMKGREVFPVIAQQSIRELNLTDRTYDDVLASAVWAVIQEGWHSGYGADGDHLKTASEVKMALNCGFTMITLDCSEYIDDSIENQNQKANLSLYSLISQQEREYWENKYLSKTFSPGRSIAFSIDEAELAEAVLIYGRALDFAENIYNDIIRGSGDSIDFEMSIDETMSPTSIKAHYIIGSEFHDRGVRIKNMAPRFCGEFQKGIDFRGDLFLFKEELNAHCAIADFFGYRISVHSGSDKFSVFPMIGELSGGNVHVKTAGTNWLEALRVIAKENPALFREMYSHTQKRLSDAKVYYHIFTEPEMVPDISGFKDDELEKLLDIEESRQALHVTYGYLLRDTNESGFIFRERFFDTLYKYEETYYEFLASHIGRHLDTLGF